MPSETHPTSSIQYSRCSSTTSRQSSLVSTLSKKRFRDETSSQGASHTVRCNPPRKKKQDGSLCLVSFLRQLAHESFFDALFKDTGVVLALFRSLQDMDKLIILRLLDICNPMAWEPFIIWHGGDRKVTIRSLNNLRSLHILLISHEKANHSNSSDMPMTGTRSNSSHVSKASSKLLGSTVSKPSTTVSAGNLILSNTNTRVRVNAIRYQLHPVFQKTLKDALAKGVSSIPLVQNKSPKHYPTRETLHAHAVSQWIQITHWLFQRTFVSKSHSKSNQETLARLCPDLLVIIELLGLHQQDSGPTKNQTHGPNLGCTHSSTHSNFVNNSGSTESTFSKTIQWLFSDRQKQISSLCIQYVQSVHCGLFVSLESSTSGLDEFLVKETSNYVSTNKSESSCCGTSYTNDSISTQTIEVLSLLFTLSEVLIGQPCSMTSLSASQRRFIQFAYSIGLVWLHKPSGSKHFFPTPLIKFLHASSSSSYHVLSSITHLTSSLAILNEPCELPVPQGLFDTFFFHQKCLTVPSELYDVAYEQFFNQENQNDSGKGTRMVKMQNSIGIIVESNFKVYTYVTEEYSSIPILLAYLCEIQAIMPCMIVAIMSRQRILKAYKAGVTAEQIIQFFSTHVHPSIYAKAYLEGKPLIPDNVVSQLKIWEGERRRVTMTPACLFQFSKESELEIFSLAVNRAHGNWLIMHSELPASSHTESKQFLEWKEKLLEKKKTAVSTVGGSGGTTWCPVLAIHVEFRDQLIEFLRNNTKTAS